MKNYIILLTVIFFSYQQICTAQKKAITDQGDEVILYENGTWKYTKDFDAKDNNKIPLSSINHVRNKNASFLLKSSKGNLGFWIDPKKWNFGKSSSNKSAEYEFSLKDETLFGVIISEAVNIPIESYVDIAIQNGRDAAPDMKIVHKEYRIVNGLKVLHLQMEGTQAGVKFLYYTYYYSTENATIQFLVTSYASSFKKHASDAEELLNGLTTIGLQSATDSSKVTSQESKFNKDSTQGLYSTNNLCKQFFEGNWNYTTQGQFVTVERTFKKTIEYLENKKYLFEYDNKWINECEYEIVFKRTTKPNFTLIKVGEVIKVDILQIDKKLMRYRSSFRGTDTEAEMERSL